MQQTDPTHDSSHDLTVPPAIGRPQKRRSLFRRLVLVYYVLLAVLILALVPSYISISRYQHRIAESIGQSLGRPVHLDKVTLELLPIPGFTIQNLVVSEDPAFGNEPVIRANSVHATLRIWPLWRRRIEFLTISFTEPSVNLVHLPNGKWNLESILIQASRINAAPTAQKGSGPAPRFPYIEATGARVNLKQGQEKLPFSLNDAEFALWLPNPQEWHLRLEAHPTRTDTSVSDTGLLRLEGTLGRASTLAAVPINLDAAWVNAPLGEVTHILLARDAGIRGDLDLSAHVQGTVGSSALTTRLRVDKFRRADFVPQVSLSVDLQCRSAITNSFHSLPDAACAWTPAGSTRPVTLAASVPDIRDPATATATLTAENLPAAVTLDWLRTLSNRIPADLTAEGSFNLNATPSSLLRPGSPWDQQLNATLEGGDLTLSSPDSGLTPALAIGEIELHSTGLEPARGRRPASPSPTGLTLAPTTLALGGRDPAVLEAHTDASGYTLHLSGTVVLDRLTALGRALPQFGDGLADVLPPGASATPIRIDLTAIRAWGGTQTWHETTTRPAIPPRRRPR